MNKILLVLFLTCLSQAFCQDKNDENSKKVYVEVYGKCFKDLKPIKGAKDILPQKKIFYFAHYINVDREWNMPKATKIFRKQF